jgi:hypothetical protein
MTDIGLSARITSGPLHSLTTVYERTSGRTTPAARTGVPSQTSGSTP